MKRFLLCICIVMIFSTGCKAPISQKNSAANKQTHPEQTSQTQEKETDVADEKNKSEEAAQKAPSKMPPADFIPILAGGHYSGGCDILMGSFENGKWIDADNTLKKIKGAESFSLYSISKKLKEAKGNSVSYYEPSQTPLVELTGNPDYGIAIGSLHKANVREVVQLSLTSKEYLKIADDYLKSEGLTNAKAQIKQLYQVDLEGDGVNEVLINISNQSMDGIDAHQKAGNYSVCLLRQVVDGKVKTTPLFSAVYTEDDSEDNWQISEVADICAVVDVNGDGLLEILTEVAYYEGTSFDLFELENGQLKRQLANGLGV